MYQKSHQKVAVFGMGNVGNAVAYGLVSQGLCNEVLLVNRNKEKAIGVALDLRQSIEYQGRNMRVWACDANECGDADIVIFCLGGNPKSEDRTEILEDSCNMVRPIVEELMGAGFGGHIIVLTNPVDTIAHYIWRISGLPKSHVIGTGTALDSARLKCFLSEMSHTDPRSIMACCMGEHGDSMFIPWSAAFIGGKRVLDLVKETPVTEDMKAKNIDYSDIAASLLKEVKLAGWKIFHRTGHTCYGVASSALGIARSILRDESSVIPCSVLLDGEYGFHDVFASVPCVIDSDGVKMIFEITLNDEEKEKLAFSVNTIRKSIEISKQF